MTVDAAQLARFIGASGTDDRVGTALQVANQLISQALVGAHTQPPGEVRDQVVLEVGAEVYRRGETPSGGQYGSPDGTGAVVRGPRDPLTQVWPILRNYTTPF